MKSFFGSAADKKSGRPCFWDHVNYIDGVPDRHYAIIVYAVKTPTGRYANGKWQTYYSFDFDKTMNREQLITKALHAVEQYPLPRLRPGYSYDGPYLYSISAGLT